MLSLCVCVCVSFRDLTAATWGGSTGQSETEEEEEEGDSSLLPSELDTTQEDAATLPAQAAGEGRGELCS